MLKRIRMLFLTNLALIDKPTLKTARRQSSNLSWKVPGPSEASLFKQQMCYNQISYYNINTRIRGTDYVVALLIPILLRKSPTVLVKLSPIYLCRKDECFDRPCKLRELNMEQPSRLRRHNLRHHLMANSSSHLKVATVSHDTDKVLWSSFRFTSTRH